MPAISVTDLVKRYPGSTGTPVVAVDGVTFSIDAGEVYALLGENGAGKTTTVEILEGHRRATSGSVRVLDSDPASGGRRFRDRIGIVLQSSGIEPEFTVREVIELYGSAYSRRRTVDEVVELIDLGAKVDERVGSLSGGQRRRLDLGLGIVGHPDLLFLDEPTTGFDAAARRRAWELIAALGADGTTIVLTTHYLEEAERLADRVGVLSHGRMVAEGSPAELTSAHRGAVVTFELADPAAAGELVTPDGAAGQQVTLDGRRVTVETDDPTEALRILTTWASDRRIELEGLSVRSASLEDVFLALTDDRAGDERDRDAGDVGSA